MKIKKEQQELLKTNFDQIFKELSVKYNLDIFNSGEELLGNYPKNIEIFLTDV